MSEEKRLAMEKLLGYNPTSAAKLTPDQVEEETLRWAVDTNIVWAGDDDDVNDNDNDDNISMMTEKDDNMRSPPSRDKQRLAKYENISDLRVASSCETLLDSLAYVWSILADALQQKQDDDAAANANSSIVQLIVFPNTKPLWNYDVMANMLMAIQICKPFLPSDVDLQLDLFHPHYKHSPRMWSPEMHAPFPTLGLSLKDKSKTKRRKEDEEFDVDATRAKLDALFQSMDGNREDSTAAASSGEGSIDHATVIQQCLRWIHAQVDSPQDMEWTIQIGSSPFLLYKTLWNTILTLDKNSGNGGGGVPSVSSSMVVVPSLDSHTVHRVAVTVNAALIRLDIPVRVTQVYTRGGSSNNNKSSSSSPPPFGMIQLSSTSATVTES